MLTAENALARLKSLGSPEAAIQSQRFFKTAPGEYGAGDQFLGVRVPTIRALAKEFRELEFSQVSALLRSEIHESRLLALLIAVSWMTKADATKRRAIYDFYLSHLKWINNWDLVDTSAPQIIGEYLMDQDREPLILWARSQNLWERRISILATQQFIKSRDFADTLRIAEILLTDHEDLIHKAVGWMLREVGKRDETELVAFLNQNAVQMPRTMLRYSIERLSDSQKQAFLKKT